LSGARDLHRSNGNFVDRLEGVRELVGLFRSESRGEKSGREKSARDEDAGRTKNDDNGKEMSTRWESRV